jgi:hypothetical protein
MSTMLLETCRESKQIYIKGIVRKVGYFLELPVTNNVRLTIPPSTCWAKLNIPVFKCLICSDVCFIMYGRTLLKIEYRVFNLILIGEFMDLC